MVDEPVWTWGATQIARQDVRYAKAEAVRPWRVDYFLFYDGGGSAFSVFYWTMFGAKLAAFHHIHFRSWGGLAKLFRNAR